LVLRQLLPLYQACGNFDANKTANAHSITNQQFTGGVSG